MQRELRQEVEIDWTLRDNSLGWNFEAIVTEVSDRPLFIWDFPVSSVFAVCDDYDDHARIPIFMNNLWFG